MGGELFDLGGGSAMPLYGQKVRGLTTLKLAKVIQFMKDWRILGAALQETWRVTKDGVEIEETPDGYLIIHHVEANQNCKRGRNGVAITLSPEARTAWELGGKKIDFKRFDLPLAFVEWATLAQDRAAWRERVTEPPFAIGKPFVRIPRGDSRATPEEKMRAKAQCAAEAAERRAEFLTNLTAHQPQNCS